MFVKKNPDRKQQQQQQHQRQDNQAVSLAKQQTKLQGKLKLYRTEVAKPSRESLQQHQQNKHQQKHLHLDKHIQK